MRSTACGRASARPQYVSLYSECVKQLETKVAELEQARQQVALKEQECGRLSSLLQSGQTTGLSQLTETLQAKDRQLAQLQSEVQRLTFSANQTKRDAELAKTQLQQQVADLRVQLASRQNDSVRVAELQGKLDAKTQEASQLQQQLLTEIACGESEEQLHGPGPSAGRATASGAPRRRRCCRRRRTTTSTCRRW